MAVRSVMFLTFLVVIIGTSISAQGAEEAQTTRLVSKDTTSKERQATEVESSYFHFPSAAPIDESEQVDYSGVFHFPISETDGIESMAVESSPSEAVPGEAPSQKPTGHYFYFPFVEEPSSAPSTVPATNSPNMPEFFDLFLFPTKSPEKESEVLEEVENTPSGTANASHSNAPDCAGNQGEPMNNSTVSDSNSASTASSNPPSNTQPTPAIASPALVMEAETSAPDTTGEPVSSPSLSSEISFSTPHWTPPSSAPVLPPSPSKQQSSETATSPSIAPQNLSPEIQFTTSYWMYPTTDPTKSLAPTFQFTNESPMNPSSSSSPQSLSPEIQFTSSYWMLPTNEPSSTDPPSFETVSPMSHSSSGPQDLSPEIHFTSGYWMPPTSEPLTTFPPTFGPSETTTSKPSSTPVQSLFPTFYPSTTSKNPTTMAPTESGTKNSESHFFVFPTIVPKEMEVPVEKPSHYPVGQLEQWLISFSTTSGPTVSPTTSIPSAIGTETSLPYDVFQTSEPESSSPTEPPSFLSETVSLTNAPSMATAKHKEISVAPTAAAATKKPSLTPVFVPSLETTKQPARTSTVASIVPTTIPSISSTTEATQAASHGSEQPTQVSTLTPTGSSQPNEATTEMDLETAQPSISSSALTTEAGTALPSLAPSLRMTTGATNTPIPDSDEPTMESSVLSTVETTEPTQLEPSMSPSFGASTAPSSMPSIPTLLFLEQMLLPQQSSPAPTPDPTAAAILAAPTYITPPSKASIESKESTSRVSGRSQHTVLDILCEISHSLFCEPSDR